MIYMYICVYIQYTFIHIDIHIQKHRNKNSYVLIYMDISTYKHIETEICRRRKGDAV